MGYRSFDPDATTALCNVFKKASALVLVDELEPEYSVWFWYVELSWEQSDPEGQEVCEPLELVPSMDATTDLEIKGAGIAVASNATFNGLKAEGIPKLNGEL